MATKATLTNAERKKLTACEATIREGLRTFLEVGRALRTIRDERLYREEYDSFETYLREKWDLARSTGYQYIDAAEVTDNLMSADADIRETPQSEAHCRPLAKEEPEFQVKAWEWALEEAGSAEKVTAPVVKRAVADLKEKSSRAPEEAKGDSAPVDLPVIQPKSSSAQDERDFLIAVPNTLVTGKLKKRAVEVGVPNATYEKGVPLSVFGEKVPLEEILDAYRETGRAFKFNKTNEHVDWARYTWNPVTGCLHKCRYCYAQFTANELGRYKQGFRPTFHPGRLLATEEMKAPTDVDHVREKNVFTCSMADLFGNWVPDWIIEAVLEAVGKAPAWNFLFLTKFPQKLSRFSFPDNAWIGTTVDRQHRVRLAEKHFRKVEAPVKWLSCEPLLEELSFSSLGMFDAVVIGAQKGYGHLEDKQPEWTWVESLWQQARAAGCAVYWKENLTVRPKELPA